MAELRIISSGIGIGQAASVGRSMLLEKQLKKNKQTARLAVADIPAVAGGSGNPDMHGFRTKPLRNFHLLQQGSGGLIFGTLAMGLPGQTAIMGTEGYFEEGTPLLVRPNSSRPSGQTIIDPAQEPTGYKGSTSTGIIEKRFPFKINGNTFFKNFLFEVPHGYQTQPDERYYGGRQGPDKVQTFFDLVHRQLRGTEPVGFNSVKDPDTGLPLQNNKIITGEGWNGDVIIPDPGFRPQITGIWEFKRDLWRVPSSLNIRVDTLEEIQRNEGGRATFSLSEVSSDSFVGIPNEDAAQKDLLIRGRNFTGRGSIYIGRDIVFGGDNAGHSYQDYVNQYLQTGAGYNNTPRQLPPNPYDNEDTLLWVRFDMRLFGVGIYSLSIIGRNGLVGTLPNFLEVTA